MALATGLPAPMVGTISLMTRPLELVVEAATLVIRLPALVLRVAALVIEPWHWFVGTSHKSSSFGH